MYGILLDNKDLIKAWDSVCHAITRMQDKGLITLSEGYRLRRNFMASKSRMPTKFIKHRCYVTAHLFWWERTPEGNEQRILYIKYLYDKL